MPNKAENRYKLQQGFTLVELMVVITIMSLLVLMTTINIAATRAARDTRLAVNRLVSDIRKVQSYTLSSRTLPNGELAQYYLLKFDYNNPRQYVIQAIYNISSNPKLMDVETVTFPPSVELSLFRVSRSLFPTLQDFSQNCLLIGFAAPFAKTIFNDGCYVVDPDNLQLTDDYYSKIINFQYNVGCISTSPYNPEVCSASTDSKLAIYLKNNADINVTGQVLFNAITGSVCPMTASWTCQTNY